MEAERTTHSAARSSADRLLLIATVISGAALSALFPFLISGMSASIGVMVVALVPYGMLIWRLVRHAGSKEAPGLAMGIGLCVVAGSVIAMAINRDSSGVWQLYWANIVTTHILLTALGISAFRQGTSRKPSWRVLVRSIVDPLVYFGILFSILLYLAVAASDI